MIDLEQLLPSPSAEQNNIVGLTLDLQCTIGRGIHTYISEGNGRSVSSWLGRWQCTQHVARFEARVFCCVTLHFKRASGGL